MARQPDYGSFTERIVILVSPKDVADMEKHLDGRLRSRWIRDLIKAELAKTKAKEEVARG